MKHHLCKIFLAAAVACSAPAVLAESVIVKCVDAGGRVTLTDQPCEAGAATVRMASMPSGAGAAPVEPYPLMADASTLPPARELGRRALPTRGAHAIAKPMSADVATLKAARAEFLMADAMHRQTLARAE